MVLQANLLPRKRSWRLFKHSPGWPQEWKPFSTLPRDGLSLNAMQPPAHIGTYGRHIRHAEDSPFWGDQVTDDCQWGTGLGP